MIDPRAVLDPGERVLWQSSPGAGRLFLSVLPLLLRDIAFLLVLGFALYAGGAEAGLASRALCVALIALFGWLLVRHLRAAFAAGVSHYLITDSRIVLIMPRSNPAPFVILRRMPMDADERHRSRWLKGTPSIGRNTRGRATIRLPYEHYRQRSKSYPDMAYRTDTVRLHAVTDPDRAVALIGQSGG